MEKPIIKNITKEEINAEDSYTINSDKNHSFNITFQNLNSTIRILASYQDDIIKHNYEKELTLNELKQNKYLSTCETISEIYEELMRLMKKNQIKLIEETNKIYISIPIDYFNVKEILFIVNEIVKNDIEKNNKLFSIISNMEEEIKEFKKKIKQINNLKEEINNIKEENKKIKEENKNIKEENKNLKKNNLSEISNLRLEINDLKEENKKMKEENKNLKDEINNIKEENKNIKENMNSSINKSINLENQIKNLNEEIEIINKTINNQNPKQIPEKKGFYECFFEKGNDIVNIIGIELMEMNYVLNYEISLINKGNLPWPKNTFIYGKSNDGLLECKPIILNKNKEIMPKEKIVAKISITIFNIKNIINRNYEIILPLKLSFEDKSKPIKQNGFVLKVKATNLISRQMFEKIKEKLEEDYSLSNNTGWSDEELMQKIYFFLSYEMIEKLGKDDEYIVVRLAEDIGEYILDI